MRSRAACWLSMYLTITPALRPASHQTGIYIRVGEDPGRSAQLANQGLRSGGVAHLGGGNEIGEDIAALGPGPGLASQGVQFGAADPGLQFFLARHQAGIAEPGRRLIDLGEVLALGVDDRNAMRP